MPNLPILRSEKCVGAAGGRGSFQNEVGGQVVEDAVHEHL